MKLNHFLLSFFAASALFWGYDMAHAQAPRPVWIGKNCGQYYFSESHLTVPNCIRDTLNLLNPESAVTAKIVSLTSGNEGAFSTIWVFYRQ